MKNLILALSFLMLPLFSQADNQTLHIQVKEAQPGQAIEDTYLRYDFGLVPINFPRSVVYTITAGEVESRVREIVYSGASYYVRTNCPLILSPKQACDVRIDFNPHFPGLLVGRVIVDLYTQRFIIDLWGQGY